MIEKPSFAFIPEEYVLTGWSIKGPSSEKSIISCILAFISLFFIPTIKPFRRIFSRPERLFCMPALAAIIETSPLISTCPVVCAI